MSSVPDDEPPTKTLTVGVKPLPADVEPQVEGGPAPGTRVGRYVVEQRLAGGGMGVVYRAHDPQLNRSVAIKLLRPDHALGGAELESARLRLLREAQALARVAHPNVIAVHDVGPWEDTVFVAMELVDGVTLKEWLKQSRRAPHTVVEVYRDAARALAAVHRAGLVHRDFKPTNVMIGTDGRVRVLDFGLARAHETSTAEPSTTANRDAIDPHATDPRAANRVAANADADTPAVPPPARDRLSVPEPAAPVTALDSVGSSRSSLLSDELTGIGKVVGTPAFMSPEQQRGEHVDARSDQFSFCAALYWSLYGSLPYDETVAASTSTGSTGGRGRVRMPPRDTRVPARVRRVLMRGLAERVEDRWPSLDVVARELDLALRRPRRVWLLSAAVLLVGGLTVLLSWRHDHTSPLCRGLDAEMNTLWSVRTRAALQSSLLAGGRPDATSTFVHVARVFDGYAKSWIAMRVDACEATQVRGVQSPQLLDLRMSCLDRGRTQMAALLDVLERHPERGVLDKAVAAALELPPVDACADQTLLQASVPPPADPRTRAEVKSLMTELASVQARFDTGLYQDGKRAAEPLATRAAAVGYAPALAQVDLLLGSLQEETGDPAAARDTLSRAASVASEAKDDLIAARAWTKMVKVIGVAQAKHEDVALLAQMAETAIVRAGRPPRLEAELLAYRGSVALESGKYADAEAIYRRAVQLTEGAGEQASAQVLVYRSTLASTLAAQGRVDEARPLFEATLAGEERLFGPDHPLVARLLSNLGLLYQRQGKLEKSRQMLERALHIFEHSLGPEDPHLGETLNNLSATLSAMGRYDEALAALQRAVHVWSHPGAENPDLCYALASLSNMLVMLSELDEAWKIGVEGLDRFEKTYGGHPDVAFAQSGLGDVLARRGRYRDAEARYQLALEIRRKSPGDPRLTAANLISLGLAQISRGRGAEARASLDHAVALIGVLTPPSKDGETVSVQASALQLRSAVELRDRHEAQAVSDAQAALDMLVKENGADSVALTDSLIALGRAQLQAGHPALAQTALERALRILPPRSPDVPSVLIDLATGALAQSRRPQALGLLERAGKLTAMANGPAERRARARLLLAQAAEPSDGVRSRALAREADALYATADAGAADEDRTELKRWLARQTMP